MTQHFGYAIDRRYLPLLPSLPVQAGPGCRDVERRRVRGHLRLLQGDTTRDNTTRADITRNYRWWTAFGVWNSMADDGLSFGINHEAGVCIHFAEKVPSRLSKSGHSALTVTVEDLEGLTRALGSGPDVAA